MCTIVEGGACRCAAPALPSTDGAATVLGLLAFGLASTVTGAVFDVIWVLWVTALALGWAWWWKPTRWLLRLTGRVLLLAFKLVIALGYLAATRRRRVSAPLPPPRVTPLQGVYAPELGWRPPVHVELERVEAPGRPAVTGRG